ncbi:Uncharacterised protein [Mycobacteroides abscessus subsp. abscessus]|nr:Uncharacterised protein [Mycobacteroides abscessus subsp. abscessus]
MNSEGREMMSLSTAYAQNCRETWNCSLMAIALVVSTPPSAVFGV